MEEISDERYSIADEAIYDAFFLILKEKELDKITVTDIIKKAGIVRSTFYNHFENIPAWINAIEDKTINEIFNLMESFHAENDHDICKSYFLALCNYTMKNRYLADILKSPRGNNFFEKTMTMFHDYVRHITNSVMPLKHSKQEFSYMVVPAEAVAEFMTQTFMTGMLPFMR